MENQIQVTVGGISIKIDAPDGNTPVTVTVGGITITVASAAPAIEVPEPAAEVIRPAQAAKRQVKRAAKPTAPKPVKPKSSQQDATETPTKPVKKTMFSFGKKWNHLE
jgi:hypothetical protein